MSYSDSIYDYKFLLDLQYDDPVYASQNNEQVTDVSNDNVSPAGRCEMLKIYSNIHNFVEFDTPLDDIIKAELKESMVTVTATKPHCVHALGVVSKPDGAIRPIMDCSRPLDIAVNNFSSSLIEPFHYMSVNDVTKDLSRYDFVCH